MISTFRVRFIASTTNERYSEALKKLIVYRRQACIRGMFSGGPSTTVTACIFLSKQPHWGGFQDVIRQETKGTQEFKITLSGPDGKAISK